MEFRKTRKPSTTFCVLLAICITFAATLLFVYFCNDGVVFIPKSQFGDVNKALMVGEIANYIDTEFYGDAPSTDELLNIAAKAMVEALNDPYAEYFTPEEWEEYYKSFYGGYVGIGIIITPPDDVGVTINSVFEDSPADKAGLKAGDIITKVNGETVVGADDDTLNQMLSGEEGDVINLTILRKTETLEISVTVGLVPLKYVHSRMIDDTGYILIDMFGDTTAADFQAAIDDLAEQGMDSLIIDLRDNPGGSLNSVVACVDAILNEGIIVTIGRSPDEASAEVYEATEGGVSVPVVVLVNGNSASASEIFAAAISENEAGILVGTTTYGKGIVQTTLPVLSSGGYLKITTDAYFTPKGNSIHGKGVKPDFVVILPSELSKYPISEIPFEKDAQLQKALEQVKQMLQDN
ncbi:MAG TPA: S41 family peptidase [Clostridiales bacterium]|jgi:carboxyl-terminal processing protease|nr:S41 family peptidase [Clostridiales bacterium]